MIVFLWCNGVRGSRAWIQCNGVWRIWKSRWRDRSESQRAGSAPEVGSDLRLASGALNALTDVPGIEVGHYTHDRVQRGVTAILCRAAQPQGLGSRR